MQLNYLKYDLCRYFYPNNEISKRSVFEKIRIVIFTHGIWAIVMYRFMRWVIYEFNVPVLRTIFKIIGAFIELIVQCVTGISIDTGCEIGPGLFIGHFGCIFIHSGVKIGKLCNIGHENTIGVAGRGGKRGVPTIGDFVYLGAGVKIIGKVKIGNCVAIGANAVVTKDFPDNAVVTGIPAGIINFNSSSDFIEFNRDKNRDIL